MRALLVVLVGAVPLAAQTYFLGMGGGAYDGPARRGMGYLAVAVPLGADRKIYQFNTVEMCGSGKPGEAALVYSTRIGFAKQEFQAGPVSLWSLATGGTAVSGSATSGAGAFGGIILYAPPWQQTPGLRFTFAAQGLVAPSAGGWQPLLTFGVGYLFSEKK